MASSYPWMYSSRRDCSSARIALMVSGCLGCRTKACPVLLNSAQLLALAAVEEVAFFLGGNEVGVLAVNLANQVHMGGWLADKGGFRVRMMTCFLLPSRTERAIGMGQAMPPSRYGTPLR